MSDATMGAALVVAVAVAVAVVAEVRRGASRRERTQQEFQRWW